MPGAGPGSSTEPRWRAADHSTGRALAANPGLTEPPESRRREAQVCHPRPSRRLLARLRELEALDLRVDAEVVQRPSQHSDDDRAGGGTAGVAAGEVPRCAAATAPMTSQTSTSTAPMLLVLLLVLPVLIQRPAPDPSRSFAHAGHRVGQARLPPRTTQSSRARPSRSTGRRDPAGPATTSRDSQRRRGPARPAPVRSSTKL
jgi:hypothetical protein